MQETRTKFRIAVTVDTNDADYNTKVSFISESLLAELEPLIRAIKKKGPRQNYLVGDCCRRDLGEKPPTEMYPEFSERLHDKFRDLCPYIEGGFHTIESITVSPVTATRKLL